MRKGGQMGELEHLVLLAVVALGKDAAYGMKVRRVLRERAGRRVSVPTVYSALDRLESKGLVESRVGDPTAERGGRAKKLFEATPDGVAALHEARAVLDRMWSAAALGPEKS